ncbi:hypothetical protein [Acidovorax sp. SUPP3334]|uniref:hypothetical protein n=1 Tax=Acidovorax sp. SUPP3334 TaxID=2920881 RepID=UPI0023DE3A34|nr:hypothetical protein [Acidovorax sp. SUPP3334]GKT27288.1 hypothetical protein AVHM3334_22975 [Acidovorax sp. SUPP3334]
MNLTFVDSLIAASHQAATELLAQAASEASAAAQKRRQVEHEWERLKLDGEAVEAERETIQKQYGEVAAEWTCARAAEALLHKLHSGQIARRQLF